MSIAQMSRNPRNETASSFHARVNGIDVFRFLSIIGVIFIHAVSNTSLGYAAALASRFAVPFFFIVAGYFLAIKPNTSISTELSRILKRILLPFLVWLFLYLIYFNYDFLKLANPYTWLMLFVQPDPPYHLWFLPSLAFATALLIIMRRICGLHRMIATAIVLYLVGLAVGPYARVTFPGIDLGLSPRNGLFLGLPFMIAGYCIRQKGWERTPFVAGALLYGVGLIVSMGEVHGLRAYPGKLDTDLLIGTLPMGVGVFVMALRLPDFVASQPLATLGRYSLGMFAVHLALVLEFRKWFAVDTFETELIVVALTLLISSAIAVAMGQFKITRPLVR